MHGAKVPTLSMHVFRKYECDQEKSQSQTADKPMARRGRVAQQSQDTRKTNYCKQSNRLSLHRQDDWQN